MISARNANITSNSYFVYRPMLNDVVAISGVQKSMLVLLLFCSCKFASIKVKINHMPAMQGRELICLLDAGAQV